VRVLLLDADGNLFPSEEPAFTASAEVTSRFLAWLGLPADATPERLLATRTGRNFRATAVDLALAAGVAVDAALLTPDTAFRGVAAADAVLTAAVLDPWVAEEAKVVTRYLAKVLRPDPAVLGPVRRLARQYRLAAVTSSALSRLDVCLEVTGLAGLIPAHCRFSAEDSPPQPTSKPDPAVYQLAGQRLGVHSRQALAVEDSVPGVQAAVAAGLPVVGNLMFVTPPNRTVRRANLVAVGAVAVVESWSQLADKLLDATSEENKRIRP
jgi:beta-phosphoglucomutase-like phosphatase (HAD superfamily)